MREVPIIKCVIFGILVHTLVVEGLWCDRTPTGVTVPKTSGDNGFKIFISGDPDKPDKYIPGAVYTGKPRFKCLTNPDTSVSQISVKFIIFLISSKRW